MRLGPRALAHSQSHLVPSAVDKRTADRQDKANLKNLPVLILYSRNRAIHIRARSTVANARRIFVPVIVPRRIEFGTGSFSSSHFASPSSNPAPGIAPSIHFTHWQQLH
ncbi:hypothetical protein ACMFMG_005938 [Clarireedia jacksonii]